MGADASTSHDLLPRLCDRAEPAAMEEALESLADGRFDGAFDDPRVLDASRFAVTRLLTQRAERYGPRTLFTETVRVREVNHSWIEVITRVDHLACLGTGLVNLIIPATATETDVARILARVDRVAPAGEAFAGDGPAERASVGKRQAGLVKTL